MPKRGSSKIDRLPENARELLNELLRDLGITQTEARQRVNDLLVDLGHPERLGKNDVSRYDQKMRHVGEKMRQAREVAKVWIGKLGAAPQGEVGNLINEILRTLSLDVALKLQAGDLDEKSMPATVEMLRHLSLSVMRLEKAASENVKRDAEIRKRTLAEAAEAAAAEAKKQGAGAGSIDALRQAIMTELAA